MLLLRFQRFDHDKLAHRSLVEELDASADLGEKGVVFAASHVQAGLHPGSALTHDDGAAGDNLSAECLEAQAAARLSRARFVNCPNLFYVPCVNFQLSRELVIATELRRFRRESRDLV